MKVYIRTLGCAKNLVEAENIAGELLFSGHELTTDIRAADMILVHTCSFIEPARKESLSETKRLIKLSAQSGKKIYISGCLPQYFLNNKSREKEIDSVFSKADGFFGTSELGNIGELIKGNKKMYMFSKKYITSAPPGGLLSTSKRIVHKRKPWAYIRIAEGCDHVCNYCLIPSLRGHFRSRATMEIVNETEKLIAAGVKEINLICQDTAGYGKDLAGEENIVKLLLKLEKIKGVEWIRLLYCHPNSVNEKLIEHIASSKKTVHYMDVPFQHISDKMLSLMGRKMTKKQVLEKLKMMFDKIPDMALRTTFIVGHPGETEKDFNELCDFVESANFLWVGLFKYYRQKMTVSGEMKPHIPEKIKNERFKFLRSLADEVTEKKYKTFFKKPLRALMETDGAGRTYLSAPEVDGHVKIRPGRTRGNLSSSFADFIIQEH